MPFDVGGRYVYLRDDEDGDYWSASWQPVGRPLDSYECRQGLSYTSIGASRNGVRTEMLYFVPPGETLEVWRLRVSNERDVKADISVFSSIEFCLWDAQDDATNFQRNFSTGEVEVIDSVIYHKSEYRERRNHFAYFACSEPLAGFDTQRDTFLGHTGAGTRPKPLNAASPLTPWLTAGRRSGLTTYDSRSRPMRRATSSSCLATRRMLQDEKFDPPGSQTINKARVQPVIDRWTELSERRTGVHGLRDSWDAYLGVLEVTTPDEDTNGWSISGTPTSA